MRSGPRWTLLVAALLPAFAVPAAHAQTPDSWTTLDTGLYSSDLLGVQALTFGPDGLLYVGGGFYNLAGRLPLLENIATWDGTAWAPIGAADPGNGGTVFAVLFGPDGRLYAGGGVRDLGGERVQYVGVFDGTAWEEVSGGTDGTVFDAVWGPDDRLFVVGSFDHAAWLLATPPVEADGVAVWDGTAWEAVGETGFGPNRRPFAVEVGADGRLYVGGEFDGLVQVWDGTAWAVLPGLLPGRVNDLAFGPDGRLYAACTFRDDGPAGAVDDRVMAWDGAAWAQVGPAFPVTSSGAGTPKALAFGPAGQFYVGGTFNVRNAALPPRGVARLDGAAAGVPGSGTWADLDGGVYLTESDNFFSDGVNALAVGPDGVVYVGGFFNKAGPGFDAYHVAAWGGDRLPVAGAPGPGSASLGVSVSPNPSSGAASATMTLTVASSSASAVRVVVWDALGRVVAVLHDGPVSAGSVRLSLPSGLAAGMYAVVASSSAGASARARWVVGR